jgi:hypothetical protein
MGHPCASRNPPSWCGRKKRKRKGGRKTAHQRAFAGYAARVSANPISNGFKSASKATCLKKTGRLKKGCIWGRGKHKGKLFKKAAR